MAKYQKKPIIIEALQLRWDTWNEMCYYADVGKLSDGKPQGCYVTEDGRGVDDYPGDSSPSVPVKIGMWIPTLEGLILGTENDWIIRGVMGELYPCKPDIFEMTYELVEE